MFDAQSLLGEPNNASPLNAQAASLWNDQVKPSPESTAQKQYIQGTVRYNGYTILLACNKPFTVPSKVTCHNDSGTLHPFVRTR